MLISGRKAWRAQIKKDGVKKALRLQFDHFLIFFGSFVSGQRATKRNSATADQGRRSIRISLGSESEHVEIEFSSEKPANPQLLAGKECPEAGEAALIKIGMHAQRQAQIRQIFHRLISLNATFCRKKRAPT